MGMIFLSKWVAHPTNRKWVSSPTSITGVNYPTYDSWYEPPNMIFLQQIAEVLPYHLSIYLKYFDVIPG